MTQTIVTLSRLTHQLLKCLQWRLPDESPRTVFTASYIGSARTTHRKHNNCSETDIMYCQACSPMYCLAMDAILCAFVAVMCVYWSVTQQWKLFYCWNMFTYSSHRNGTICHIVPSLKLFVPNSLSAHQHSFLLKFLLMTSLSCCPVPPRWSLSNCYIPFLLKGARPERPQDKVETDPGVPPSSLI
jgi:hypothetical protein